MVGIVVLLAGIGRAVRTAWRNPAFKGALSSLVILLTCATAFYCLHEGWSVLDSLYFTVETGLTIGYGDFVPTTAVSKVFTMLYTMLAVGLFFTVGGMLADTVTKRGPSRSGRRPKRPEEEEDS